MANDFISREDAINTQERRCLGCPVDRRLWLIGSEGGAENEG